jgi:hypothetical protein
VLQDDIFSSGTALESNKFSLGLSMCPDNGSLSLCSVFETSTTIFSSAMFPLLPHDPCESSEFFSGEYRANEFTRHLHESGTTRQLTVHDPPPPNQIAERCNGLLVEHGLVLRTVQQVSPGTSKYHLCLQPLTQHPSVGCSSHVKDMLSGIEERWWIRQGYSRGPERRPAPNGNDCYR